MNNRNHAFTLTDLAAALCVASLSAAAILPCLAAAQTNAQSAVAYANLNLLTRGQIDFASSNDLLLPGPHSSGWQCRITHGQAVVGDTTPSTPTQNQDWISPSVGDELNLSPNRAERTWQIFRFLADPRAIRSIDQLYLNGPIDDADDLETIQETRGYLQVSYLASAPFYLVPYHSNWSPEPYFNDGAIHSFPDPAAVPTDYIPRLDLVGPPATKVAAADGTRYIGQGGGLIGSGTVLDIIAQPDDNYYGNFLTSTPIFDESIAYGRDWLPVQFDNENVRLSMRYPTNDSAFGRGMHTARFDGSVTFITAEQAWGDPALWYPTGSMFSGVHATPEAAAIYDPGEILP